MSDKQQQPTEGIGIRKEDGKVYLDFFALRQTLELTSEEAIGFAETITRVANDTVAAS